MLHNFEMMRKDWPNDKKAVDEVSDEIDIILGYKSTNSFLGIIVTLCAIH